MRTSPCNGFLADASRSSDAIVAAVADNCRFDERASDERWTAFEATLPSLPPSAWEDWTEAYQLHLERTCKVAGPSVPDAFLDANRDAWLTDLSENQSLVRIEDLRRPLQDTGLEYNALEALWEQTQGLNDDAEHAVRSFCQVWNQRRDARPTFAAFADEVQDELDDDDWPHALRDRLGLGHLGLSDGSKQPIALMRYSIADVLAAQERQPLAAVACALPTVLDGGMHEFFFPAPRQHPYGATVHLVPGRADTLTAEIVHCRIDYEPRHLYRLGEITHPIRLNDSQLRQARDLHLYALREECGRHNFGEALEGRT